VNIKGVGNNVNRYTELYKKQEEATSRQTQKKTDKLDLSDAAKKLKAEGVESKQLTEVKLKVQSGYYNSDEVINQVADEILKTFSEEN
jgi:anti-sigma28 factor (negative regulator of flagellin synthesis)